MNPPKSPNLIMFYTAYSVLPRLLHVSIFTGEDKRSLFMTFHYKFHKSKWESADGLSRRLSPNGARELARASATCKKLRTLANQLPILRVVNLQNVGCRDQCGPHHHINRLLSRCVRAGNLTAVDAGPEMVVALDTNPLVATPSVTCFNQGRYTVSLKKVSKSFGSDAQTKTQLCIVYPDEQGTYPVILFLHGFMILDTCYSELFRFIASHGYIIVAPGQSLCDMIKSAFISSAMNEVDSAAETANWISESQGQNLQLELPQGVSPDLECVALAGHSKGGKAAFALALGCAQTSLKFKALIGLDPVAGVNTSNRCEPKILSYIPQSFNISIPVAVIGTGLGDDGFCCCIPPAAPFGCNSPFFFNECKPPCCYFLAKDYGHMDMVDGWLAWVAGKFICKSGDGSKSKMRAACGGIIVAFLKAYFSNDTNDLTAIVDSPDSVAPIKIDPAIWLQP